MTVYISLPEGETKDKIIQAISLCCGIVVADERSADVCISDSKHPLLDTVVVSTQPPESLEDVIDVILPNQTLEYYIMKMKLLHCYVYSKCSPQGFLDEEVYKAQRYNIPLSVILVQIMSKSTSVAQFVYNSAKRQMRVSDRAVFLQPNSLFVLLPYTPIDGAKIFAARLLRRIERTKVKGIAAFPDVIFAVCQVDNQVIDSTDLFFKLEEAVQRAFQEGRKIVVT